MTLGSVTAMLTTAPPDSSGDKVDLLAALGVMGGFMQPQVLAQIWCKILSLLHIGIPLPKIGNGLGISGSRPSCPQHVLIWDESSTSSRRSSLLRRSRFLWYFGDPFSIRSRCVIASLKDREGSCVGPSVHHAFSFFPVRLFTPSTVLSVSPRKKDILTNWCTNKLMYWRIDALTNWCTDKLIYWQIDVLTNWCIDKFIFWQIGILTDINDLLTQLSSTQSKRSFRCHRRHFLGRWDYAGSGGRPATSRPRCQRRRRGFRSHFVRERPCHTECRSSRWRCCRSWSHRWRRW